MVDKCRSDCGNSQSVLDVNREILMKTSDINNIGNAYRSIYEAKTKEEEVSDNKDFKPHMMYDPETGKGYKAEKPEDHERMSKMGYTHEEPDMVKEKKLPRQMLDPKKDVMVVKNNKVIVVDKSKEAEYLKKGWGLAEQIDEAKGEYASDAQMDDFLKGIENHPDIIKMSKHYNRPVGDIVKALRTRVKVNRLSGGNVYTLDFVDKDSKLKVKAKKKYTPIEEAVSPAQQAAIAISKKEKGEEPKKENDMKNEEVNEEQVDESLGALAGFALGKGIVGRAAGAAIGHAAQKVGVPIVKTLMKRRHTDRVAKKTAARIKKEGSVKDIARQIDKVVAKMNKDSKLKPFAKKFASMAMDTMDIEKSLEKSLPSNIDGAKMIGLLEGKTKSEDASQFVAAARQAKKDGKDTFIFADKEYPVTCKEVEEAEKKLDPVDDAANDKKFKDRKDKDIDNDGDVDSSDEYLHNRRAKVDDAIDGGKKPAKKEEEKDPKKKVAKSPKTAEISKIGEDFVAMLEASLLEKAEPEAIDDKESPKGKEFIAKHKKSDKDLEDKEKEAQEETPKAGKVTKEKSGKRSIDNPVGDKKVVKPVKEGTSISLVDQARAHLAGEKNPHLFGKEEPKLKKESNPFDGRTKLAREFMQRMDKRRGITHNKKPVVEHNKKEVK